MAEPDRKLSRDALIQGAGLTSLASLLAAVGATPAEAAAGSKGPWNLSLTRIELLDAKSAHHHSLPATTVVTAIFLSHKPPLATDVPSPFTPIAVYEIDAPWIEGSNEDDTPEKTRKLTHNVYLVMCTG